MRRQAWAMLVSPVRRWRLTAKLRRVAITAGPLPVRIWGQVLAEGHVADPVQCLDPPVPAEGVGDQVGTGLVPGQADDRVDGLAAPGRGANRSAAADDLDGEAGVREPDPGAH